MLDQINAQLKNIMEDIRHQGRIHRKMEVSEERIKLKKEELNIAEKTLKKAHSTYQKLEKYSPKASFFNLVGNREKKREEAKNHLEVVKKQRDLLTSEITQMIQEQHKLRQKIEALEPLEKLKRDLIQLKEEYLLKTGNSQLLTLTEAITSLKLDMKELGEAIIYSKKYWRNLSDFQDGVFRSVTWGDLEKCARYARKMMKMSETLETELIDVLNVLNSKSLSIPINPHQLGKFWLEICRLLEWNYTYEYSQDRTQAISRKHSRRMVKTIQILTQYYRKSKISLQRSEERRIKLLEEI